MNNQYFETSAMLFEHLFGRYAVQNLCSIFRSGLFSFII